MCHEDDEEEDEEEGVEEDDDEDEEKEKNTHTKWSPLHVQIKTGTLTRTYLERVTEFLFHISLKWKGAVNGKC